MPPSLARERTTGKLSCGLMIERCPPVLQVQSGFSSTVGCNLHIYEGTINATWQKTLEKILMNFSRTVPNHILHVLQMHALVSTNSQISPLKWFYTVC